MAAPPDLTRLHRSAGGLFEAPRYDRALGLIFADARLGGVFALRPGSGIETLIAHRRGIGGLARHQDGGFVVSGRNVAHRTPDVEGRPTATSVLLDPKDCEGAVGFNDLTVDQSGRVYVGSFAPGALEATPGDPSAPSGDVFLLDLDGSSRVVADDIRLPNGAALAPDCSHLYFCDSGRSAVFRFDVEPDTGALSNRRLLVDMDSGVPDGMAVAEDGSLWVANAHAGIITRYGTDGGTIETWSVPDRMVTSLCFGGDNGRQIFITTGAEGPTGTAAIYTFEADVAGVEVPAARVRPR